MDFQKIIAGMTGQQFMDAINGNFDVSKEQFNTVATNILLRVIANNVKQLKSEDGKLFFTIDEKNWIPVDNNKWGSITGSLNDQTDLKSALGEKAGTDEVKKVANDVSSVKNEVAGVKTTVDNNKKKIDENTKAVGELQRSDASKVSSSNILSIRIASNGFLQYSIDGVTWNNVQSIAEINWGSIGGEISNQVDLKAALDSKVKQSDFDNHKSNQENPHNVTKSQVGLSNVDNTSDSEKPISEAQRLEFDAIKRMIETVSNNKLNSSEDITAIEYITLAEYNKKKDEESLIDTVIYIVD